jgi:aspartate racemase
MTQSCQEKVVGILGGMGPYATLSFFQCLLDCTPAEKDWNHVHVIIDNNPKIPSRTRAFLFGEADPVAGMVESANRLGRAGCDFVVVPCNSAHFFLPRVREQTQVPFIDMVDETSRRVLEHGWKRVGLLAGEVTVKGRLYEARLERHGVTVLQVDDEQQTEVRDVIEYVKKNAGPEKTRPLMERLLKSLQRRGSEVVILGCTELPLAMPGVRTECPTLDSARILGEAAIQRSKNL